MKNERLQKQEDEPTLAELMSEAAGDSNKPAQAHSRLALQETADSEDPETAATATRFEKQKNELTPELISKYLRSKLANETPTGLTWKQRFAGWDMLDGIGPWVTDGLMMNQLPVLGVWMQIRNNMELLKQLAAEMDQKKVGLKYMKELVMKVLLGKRRRLFEEDIVAAKEELNALTSAGLTPEQWSKTRRERLVKKYRETQNATLALMEKLDRYIQDRKILQEEVDDYPDIFNGMYFKD